MGRSPDLLGDQLTPADLPRWGLSFPRPEEASKSSREIRLRIMNTSLLGEPLSCLIPLGIRKSLFDFEALNGIAELHFPTIIPSRGNANRDVDLTCIEGAQN